MKKKGGRTKKQHFVPRFYIERFADEKGFICSYDFEKDTVIQAKSKDTGLEQNFYSPMNESGERFDELEIWLSQVESIAAPLFDDLHTGRTFIGDEREKLALFIAAQYTRSPMLISCAADFMGQMAHHVGQRLSANPNDHEKSMDEYDKETGENTSAEEREKMREFLLNTQNYKINVLQQAGLSITTGAVDIAKLFIKMNWFVSEVKNQHLITSDSPVVKVSDPKTYSAYGDGGFLNKTMYVTFPLSPTRILIMSWMGKEDGVVRVVGKQTGRLYNRQRASWAKRFLYANCRDSGIVALGNKVIKNGQRPRIVSGESLPEIEVKRTL